MTRDKVIKRADGVLDAARELKYELERVPIHKGAVHNLLNIINANVYKLRAACKQELNINVWVVRNGEDARKVAPKVADKILDYPDNKKMRVLR